MARFVNSLSENKNFYRIALVSGALLAAILALWLTGPAKTALHAVRPIAFGSINRTVPHVTPPKAGVHFSAAPSDAEFLQAGLFREPLVPAGLTTAAENRDFARAVMAYSDQAKRTGERDSVGPLTAFLASHPHSAWAPSLLVNLGTIYRQTGHFSKAMAAWQLAWTQSKGLTTRTGHAIGDVALADLSQFQAYLGRTEDLRALLTEATGRPMHGAAAELVSESSRGLAHMERTPQLSFRCGPLALLRILLHEDPHPKKSSLDTLERSYSTPKGLSLAAVQKMSVAAGMNYQMAFRSPGAKIIMPAVAHWKMGHYAAIVGTAGNRYIIQDSTFGEDIRVSPTTLEEELSGYFLVPKGSLPAGWRKVGAAEGETIWGRGDTGDSKDNNDSGPGAGDALGGPKDNCDGTTDCDGNNPNQQDQCSTGGCTTWNVEPMTVSLALHDMPVGYTPPVGPAVHIDIYYSQRDVQQPAVFNYVNFGPQWTMTWLSYVTDNIQSNGTANLYQRGGGAETYSFSSNTSDPGPFTQAVLVRSVDGSGNTTGFVRQLKDGSSEVFAQALGNQFFMTAVVDRQGNKVAITYDSQMRIMALTDAIGQVTTFTYGGSDPLKVTKITDPFGRSASFTYNASGQLASITDVLGITSQYTYGPGDFVNQLQTPYGITKFVFGDSTTDGSLGDTRFINVTDTLGRTSRVEFNQNAPGSNYSGPDNAVPTGMNDCNCYLEFRNTYIWNPNQYQSATAGGSLDYSQAKLIHWLHTADGSATSRNIESIKEPLENRVWYDYPGQYNPIYSGTSNTPLHIGRVLDNGDTQLRSYQYNAQGNVTQYTDPTGRTLTYSYAANGIDVLTITNTTGGGNQLLATFTYNAQHEPLTVTGANGKTATYVYNAAGQPTSFTDAAGNVTTYTYDAHGYLTTIQGPVSGAKYSYTYDSPGRIASATDPAGATVNYTYDNADRPTQATFPDSTTTKFAYTNLDLTGTTDRLGQTTQLAYDSERQLIKITDPLSQVTQFGYSPSGKLASITDPNGHATMTARDGEDRIVTKTYADGTKQTLVYEATISRVHAATDALNQATTYSYNDDDSVASIAYTNAPNVSFTYDAAYPRLTGMTDGTGTTTYAYNPVAATPALGANQLQSVTSPVAGATGVNDTVSYTYDALNRVVGRSINGAAQTTAFDALGRVTSAASPLDNFTYSYADATARVTGVSSNHGPKATLSYFDAKGDELIQKMVFATQSGTALSTFQYTYNADDNVKTFTQSYLNQKFASLFGPGWNGEGGHGYAQLGQPPAASGAAAGPLGMARTMLDKSFETGAKAVAALSDWHDQIPDMIAFAFLAMLALIILASLTLRARLGNAWRLGPVIAMSLLAAGCWGGSHKKPTPPPPTQNATAQVITYAYDAANRLTSALLQTDLTAGQSATPQNAYAYDAASNITSITLNNNKTSLSYTSTNAITPGTYDANGSPTTLGSANYSWDGANRLVKYVNGSSESDFVYDGLSRLVRIVDKTSGTVANDHSYFWCGNVRCLEHDNTKTGSPVDKQYFDQGVLIGSTAYYYVADRLGSVRQLVDASGNVAAQYDYDEYGNQTVVSGTVASDFGFAGYFYHKASGLNFALYRAYDAAHGRWLNRDLIGELSDLNLYAFVAENPVSRVDPLGLWTVNVGFSGSINIPLYGPIGVGGGGSIGFIFDGTNFGFYKVIGGGAGAGGGGSGGVQFGYSNGKTICDVRGPFGSVSGSGGEGWIVGGEGYTGYGQYGQPVTGGNLFVGVGGGTPISGTIGGTKTWVTVL